MATERLRADLVAPVQRGRARGPSKVTGRTGPAAPSVVPADLEGLGDASGSELGRVPRSRFADFSRTPVYADARSAEPGGRAATRRYAVERGAGTAVQPSPDVRTGLTSVAREVARVARVPAQPLASPVLQRASVGVAPEVAPPIVHDVLRSSGRPLEAGTRELFESRLDADLSQVRIHTDERAAASARAVSALAYTVGSSIVFDRGLYAPQRDDGRGLLAHELVHTIQQAGGGPPPSGRLSVGPLDGAAESQAQQVAAAPSRSAGARGPAPGVAVVSTPMLVQRRHVVFANAPETPVDVFAKVLIFVDGKLMVNAMSGDQEAFLVPWTVPKDAKSVRIFAQIFGSRGGGKYGGMIVADLSVAPDGTLTTVATTPLPGDETVKGRVTFGGSPSGQTAEGVTLTAESKLDASTESKSSTGSTGSSQINVSGQAQGTGGTTNQTGNETTKEPTNVFGRTFRTLAIGDSKLLRQIPYLGRFLDAVPKLTGETLLGKPETVKETKSDVKSQSGTGTLSGGATFNTGSSSNQELTGPGLGTTSVARQTVVVSVRSPPRPPPARPPAEPAAPQPTAKGYEVDVGPFAEGSAKIKDTALGTLLAYLQSGEEPTLQERLHQGAFTIKLYGYASTKGSVRDNQALGTRRAEAVKAYLMDRDGVRIPATAFKDLLSYGKQRAASTGVEDEKDRHVRVVIEAVNPATAGASAGTPTPGKTP